MPGNPVGVYTGIIDELGHIAGTTFDRNHPDVSDNWETRFVAQCVALLPPEPSAVTPPSAPVPEVTTQADSVARPGSDTFRSNAPLTGVRPKPGTDVFKQDSAALPAPPAPAPAAPAGPAGYPIACRGGGGMFAQAGNDGFVLIPFAPAGNGFAAQSPGAGECAWSDRGFRPGEPQMLAYRRSGSDAAKVKALVDAAGQGGTFQVHAYNDNNGVMVVTNIDQVVAAVEPAPSMEPGSDPGSVEGVIATVIRTVNVRDKSKKTILGKLAAGTQVAVASCDDFWCRVVANVSGGYGYVSREFLALGDAANANPAPPTKPAAPPAAMAGIDVTGTWDSHTDKDWQYTIVLVSPPGGMVTGFYVAQDGSRGTINGRLKGNLLTFDWTQATPDGEYRGSGQFAFNGNSFNGGYNTTQYPNPNTDPALLTGTWSGTRQ